MLRPRVVLVLSIVLLSIPGWAWLAPGKNEVGLRGQAQDIYYYPAGSGKARGEVLFAPGDGGWRGFAVSVAKSMSESGYDVYGLDTKRYLSSFTDANGGLSETQVASDFSQLARSLGASASHRFTLLGWSEGAGLTLLAAAEGDKADFDGLVTMGLPPESFLGWRLKDAVTYVTRQLPNEPTFSSMGYMSRISPLPLFMIESSNDEYVPLDMAERLFQAAHAPRRFQVVTASNHHFGGNQDGFFRVLQEALQWIQQQSR